MAASISSPRRRPPTWPNRRSLRARRPSRLTRNDPGPRRGCASWPNSPSGTPSAPKVSGRWPGGMWKVPNIRSQTGNMGAKFLAWQLASAPWCQRWNTGLATT